MPPLPSPYFFECSVSADLYGACMDKNGAALPTPSGGTWLPVAGLAAIGAAAQGYDAAAAARDIRLWKCHWFTSEGPRGINWGAAGPPISQFDFP